MNLIAWGKAWAAGTWSEYSWAQKEATISKGGGGRRRVYVEQWSDFPVFDDAQAKRKKRKRNEILLMMQ
jgi:hypothetical protein